MVFEISILLHTSLFNEYSILISIELAALVCLILSKAYAKLLKKQLSMQFDNI